MFIRNFSVSIKSLRKSAVVLSVLLVCLNLCVPTFAGTGRNIEPNHNLQQATDGDEVTGVIDAVIAEVQGTIIKLDGGLTVDTSQAGIFSFNRPGFDPPPVSPGASVRISFSLSADPSAPLKAEYIRVRVPNEIAFSGIIQEVQLEADQDGFITGGFIKLLNRNFTVVTNGFLALGIKRKQLKVGQSVIVIAQVNGTGYSTSMIFPKAVLGSIFP